MPDYPPGYDPIQADYNSGSYVSPEDQAIGGLIGLSAFGMIGVVALFTAEAAVAAPLTTVAVTFSFQAQPGGPVVTGVKTFCTNGLTVTQSQQQIIGTINSMGVGGLAPATVAKMVEAWGWTLLGADGLLALAAFNNPSEFFGNFGGWLGGFVPGGGGFTTPPGFPGFPANTVYGNFSGAPGGPTYGCVEIDGEQECFYYY